VQSIAGGTTAEAGALLGVAIAVGAGAGVDAAVGAGAGVDTITGVDVVPPDCCPASISHASVGT
jgi:hypothetical protein